MRLGLAFAATGRADYGSCRSTGKRIMLTIYLATACLLLAPVPALATTITAVCGEPSGHTIGVARGAPVDDVDMMKGGSFTFVSDKAGKTITVTSKDATGQVTTNSAFVLQWLPDEITFLEWPTSQGETWLYSLFPNSHFVIMSRHAQPLGVAAFGTVMTAPCSFGG